MTSVDKKRIRVLSPASDSEDKVQRNPKTHEIGGQNGEKRVKSNTCYVCDGEDNWVLVCHGEECLISIHQSCTSDEPDYDEYGNFYCPYCWYKGLVVKSSKLREKLLVIDKSRKGRESLGGVDLGLMMDKVCEDIDNVNVSQGRRVTIVNPSGIRRECDESLPMEKYQRMKEVAAETQSQEASEGGGDDEGRQKRGRLSEKNHETADACNSNAGEGRNRSARCSEKGHENVQVCNLDVDKVRKKQRQGHGTAQVHSFLGGVNTRKQGRHSEKDVVINDEGTEASVSDLGEGTSGQGCCYENNQQQKASSTESCELKVRRTDKRVSHRSELGKGRRISKDGDRKRKDMRNEEENGFGKDKQMEHNSASSISSPVTRDNINDSNKVSQELALIIHPGVQEEPIEAQPFRSVPPEKPSCRYGSKRYLEKKGSASDDPEQRRSVLSSDRKRKRLFWTQAEEEMLKVGVQKFPGFRNIPWRKILEFGRDVFHEERVPSDLKDKWKNMNKLSSEAGKWVSLPTEPQPNYLVSEPCSD